MNTFIQSRSLLKIHIRFQTKMGKDYTCFQTKNVAKTVPFGGLNKGVPPPPPWSSQENLKTILKKDFQGKQDMFQMLQFFRISIVLQRFSHSLLMFVCVLAKKLPALA